jgi:hypothetical protein
VYYSRLKAFRLHWVNKYIASNTPSWKHKKSLDEEFIECKHPRTWNIYSDDVQKVKKICEKYCHYEVSSVQIIKAIEEIVSDINHVKQNILNKNKEISKPEPFHIMCDDCECYGCYSRNMCGDCR